MRKAKIINLSSLPIILNKSICRNRVCRLGGFLHEFITDCLQTCVFNSLNLRLKICTCAFCLFATCFTVILIQAMRGGNTSLALKASVFKRIVFSAYCFSLLADIILLSYPIKEAIRVSVHEIEKRPFISLIAPPLGQCNSVKDFMFTITQIVN